MYSVTLYFEFAVVCIVSTLCVVQGMAGFLH